MSNFSSAFQGVSGLWFKTKIDSNGRKNILVAESRNGVENGSHDHYWEEGSNYGVQLRDRSGTAIIRDSKGHIYENNTTFPAMCNKSLQSLFNSLF